VEAGNEFSRLSGLKIKFPKQETGLTLTVDMFIKWLKSSADTWISDKLMPLDICQFTEQLLSCALNHLGEG
jgi:hypothetical protein